MEHPTFPIGVVSSERRQLSVKLLLTKYLMREHFVTIICKKYLRYSPVFNIQYRCTCNWIHSTIAVFHILSYNPLHLLCESTKFVIKKRFPIQITENLSNASISWMRYFLVFTCSRASECLAPVRARVWQTKAWKDSGAEQVTSKQG